jgi:hypothetical protein
MNRIAISLLATAFALAGCFRGGGIKGDGVMKTEDRPVSDFMKIAVAGGYEVQWSAGKPALRISGDQNLLPLVRSAVNGDTLTIDSTENLRSSKRITIVLSSASLAEVQTTGAINFKATQASGTALKLVSTGASEITVDGSVASLEANLTGASTLHADELQARDATLTLVGASTADIAVAEALKASITGAGSLTYSGTPTSVEQTVTGAGTIRHRQ